MKFEEAFELMRRGKNVRRKSSYIRLNCSIAKPQFCDQNNTDVVIRPQDVYADDWEIVE